ncbi:hypothetical protein N7495_008837 [Penicillium taxi]|uniref:uncharacterized protein n=1 Tax=Penicillium taxi TaxID=168475 RepID=UPI00254539D2|nr:uncharacterized protein N7495_008837 [Penicillium taxi]KAJ5888796.1 hypothetical protein N7495_008837 [Penicillium taxi]
MSSKRAPLRSPLRGLLSRLGGYLGFVAGAGLTLIIRLPLGGGDRLRGELRISKRIFRSSRVRERERERERSLRLLSCLDSRVVVCRRSSLVARVNRTAGTSQSE